MAFVTIAVVLAIGFIVGFAYYFYHRHKAAEELERKSRQIREVHGAFYENEGSDAPIAFAQPESKPVSHFFFFFFSYAKLVISNSIFILHPFKF